MLAEAKANGHDVPIDLDPFSQAIMSGRPHPEVHLQFGRHDGMHGRLRMLRWPGAGRGRRVLSGRCRCQGRRKDRLRMLLR
jgi:hypothetical protein